MTGVPLLDRMAAVADAARCRVLRLLDGQELTVSELCSVLQLPQSTVSRHLKTLHDEEWVSSRRDGTSRYYTMAPDGLAPGAGDLWSLLREQVGASAAAQQDDRRLASVLQARRSKSQAFFSSAAGQWDHLRDELFGASFHLQALLGLMDDRMVVADLGCGLGTIATSLAPFVAEVIAVDGSEDMLAAARVRVRGCPKVDLRRGDLEALPIEDGRVDAAILALVLHHAPDPARVLAEAARIVRPGGRVLIVDMLPHDRAEYQQQMGHVWLGFSEKQIARYAAAAGFSGCQVRPLPIDPMAKGPGLFVATAKK